MTIDFAATLQPAAGIARRWMTLPPQGPDRPLWTVAVDIGMGDRRDDKSPLDITWVGAAGRRRAATFVRATGEAVERSALLSTRDFPDGDGLPLAPRGRTWSEAAESGPCYMARQLGGPDVRVAVPAVAVDYPPRGSVEGCDPGPSGTASGAGLEMAVRSACKELIERDASMRGWYAPSLVRRIPVGILSEPAFLESGQLVSGLPPSVDVQLFALPTHGGAQCVLTLAIDHSHGVTGAGLGTEVGAATRVLRSVQEALQIRSLLIDLKRLQQPGPAQLPIETEIDRARYWAGPSAVDAALAWIALVPPGPCARPEAAPTEAWNTLLRDAVVVDLTPRLPEAVVALGWAVARVFSATMCPLRMSEALTWNAPATLSCSLPHPFV